VASRKSAASLPRMVAWAAGRETASRYVLAEGTFATYAFSRRPLSARSYGRSGRRAKGRGCAKTSARFRTDLFRSLLRGLKALRIERIAKNFALLDPLQIFAEFLHGLGRFDPFAAPSGYDRYLRILAIASRSPKGRNPPFRYIPRTTPTITALDPLLPFRIGPMKRAGSARKRSSVEGVGCARSSSAPSSIGFKRNP
jgi:hypothetical protein